MHIGQALNLVSRYDSLRNPQTSLGDYPDPELISRCLAESGSVTLRKRRLPLEMMVWCIVGMALGRKEPLHQIVNRLDIMLPGNRPFVAPGAVIQARQRLGSEAVRRVFSQTAQQWHSSVTHPHWCGLTLLAVDGVVWRTPDTPDKSLFTILCKRLFSEVTVKTITELDNKTAHGHPPVLKRHCPFLGC